MPRATCKKERQAEVWSLHKVCKGQVNTYFSCFTQLQGNRKQTSSSSKPAHSAVLHKVTNTNEQTCEVVFSCLVLTCIVVSKGNHNPLEALINSALSIYPDRTPCFITSSFTPPRYKPLPLHWLVLFRGVEWPSEKPRHLLSSQIFRLFTAARLPKVNICTESSNHSESLLPGLVTLQFSNSF